MKITISIIIIFLFASYSYGQITKICELPKTPTGKLYDMIIKEDSSCFHGTKSITVKDFISTYSLSTTSISIPSTYTYTVAGTDTLFFIKQGSTLKKTLVNKLPFGSGTVTSVNAGTNLSITAGTTTVNPTLSLVATPTFVATNLTGLPLSTGVTGNLSVNNLNSGTGASSTTAWFGDGTWKAPITLVAGTNISLNTSGLTTTITATGGGGGTYYAGSGLTLNIGTFSITSPISPSIGGTGTTNTFLSGSIPFIGSSGIYTENNNEFFWDNTNLRHGIGTNTPDAKLHIASTSSVTPLGLKIQVAGNYSTTASVTGGTINAEGSNLSTGLQVSSKAISGGIANGIVGLAIDTNTTGHNNAGSFIASSAKYPTALSANASGGTTAVGMNLNAAGASGGNYALLVDQGWVGIGTTTPTARLEVQAVGTGTVALPSISGTSANGYDVVGVGGTATSTVTASYITGVKGVSSSSDATTSYGIQGIASSNTSSGFSVGVRGEGAGGLNSIGGYFSTFSGTNRYALVTTGGNVGINTVTPTEQFQVAGATGTVSITSAGLVNQRGLYLDNRIVSVADDASIDLPASTHGWGTVYAGHSLTTDGFISFRYDGNAVVTQTQTADALNAAIADTDTKLCVFDNGTSVRIRNRTGGTVDLFISVYHN